MSASDQSSHTAIVGSGPAGLSCAYFLAVLGHHSVIFEAEAVPGGLLSSGIPDFRLPRLALNRRIDEIVSRDSELCLNRRIDRRSDFSRHEYGFVFLATGAQSGRPLEVPGECSPGVVDALDFLRSYCYGSKTHDAAGKRTAIIGGGHTAFDAARSAIRSGASAVTVYYRRSVAELGAYQDEIESAIEDGVELSALCQPVSFVESDGALSSMKLTRMRLTEPDREGRRFSVPIEGDEFEVSCDLVVRATGQRLPQLSVHEGIRKSSWGGLAADYQTGATSLQGVYAGGDCVLGASSVLRAIDSGKRAALGIDRVLGGTGILPPHEDQSIARPFGLFNT